ncbi:DUF1127 domain-containing protein [Jannaschia faecimaris]|uniref:DUF1127 domain-containing protein n=1 Tax=Jannaschia faecimaris TaxID=1244108 RepID=UPI001479B781|nr:DUF1127 domain-containing protein [Jannaschia faecimaris]
MLTTTLVRAFPLAPRTPSSNLFRLIARAVFTHLRNQRQYRQLHELPDYLLEDIGLTRAQAGRAAWEPALTDRSASPR